jgi:hypothetical protein
MEISSVLLHIQKSNGSHLTAVSPEGKLQGQISELGPLQVEEIVCVSAPFLWVISCQTQAATKDVRRILILRLLPPLTSSRRLVDRCPCLTTTSIVWTMGAIVTIISVSHAPQSNSLNGAFRSYAFDSLSQPHRNRVGPSPAICSAPRCTSHLPPQELRHGNGRSVIGLSFPVWYQFFIGIFMGDLTEKVPRPQSERLRLKTRLTFSRIGSINVPSIYPSFVFLSLFRAFHFSWNHGWWSVISMVNPKLVSMFRKIMQSLFHQSDPRSSNLIWTNW